VSTLFSPDFPDFPTPNFPDFPTSNAFVDNGNTSPNTDKTKNVTINNYITVDGAEDPEDWTERFIRQLKLEVRTA
jgi:hypothetical protein